MFTRGRALLPAPERISQEMEPVKGVEALTTIPRAGEACCLTQVRVYLA